MSLQLLWSPETSESGTGPRTKTGAAVGIDHRALADSHAPVRRRRGGPALHRNRHASHLVRMPAARARDRRRNVNQLEMKVEVAGGVGMPAEIAIGIGVEVELGIAKAEAEVDVKA